MPNEADDNQANVQLALSCWFLTGATASGKSQTSLFLAERLNAEIISLDSMAIYRGMDIGTAKPGVAEQARVRHHLIDVVDPTTQFSVSQYRDAALDKIREIQSTGKQVLFVGGTALYLKALLRGLFDGPPADWDFRKQVESEIAEGGVGLLGRLRSTKPPASRLVICKWSSTKVAILKIAECSRFVMTGLFCMSGSNVESNRCSKLVWSKRCKGCLILGLRLGTRLRKRLGIAK